jgi:hypothetical protein
LFSCDIYRDGKKIAYFTQDFMSGPDRLEFSHALSKEEKREETEAMLTANAFMVNYFPYLVDADEKTWADIVRRDIDYLPHMLMELNRIEEYYATRKSDKQILFVYADKGRNFAGLTLDPRPQNNENIKETMLKQMNKGQRGKKATFDKKRLYVFKNLELGQKTKTKPYAIPVAYKVTGTIHVKAENLQEAIKLARKKGGNHFENYIPGSLEIKTKSTKK